MLLTGCTCMKTTDQRVDVFSGKKLGIDQRLGTRIHPPEFYLCDDWQYPCHPVTHLFLDKSKIRKKHIREENQKNKLDKKNLISNYLKGTLNENFTRKSKQVSK